MAEPKIQKSARCPYCKGNRIRKRKLSYGYFCSDCREAFRFPVVEENKKEAV